jgi:hypothetical protein
MKTVFFILILIVWCANFSIGQNIQVLYPSLSGKKAIKPDGLKIKKRAVFPTQTKENTTYLIKLKIRNSSKTSFRVSIENSTKKFASYELGSIIKDTSDVGISSWNSFEGAFTSESCIESIVIEVDHEVYIDSLQLVELFEEDDLYSNLILNPRFDMFSRLPCELFNCSTGLYGWQKNLRGSCFETRTNLPSESTYDVNGRDLLQGLFGTPDLTVDSIGIPNVNRVNYVGRLRCDNHGVKKNGSNAIGEYLQIRLKHPLIKDSIYVFQMKYKLDPFSNRCSNSLGIKLSQCEFIPFDKASFTDQIYPKASFMVSDTCFKNRNWVTFSIEYKANGGEEFLTIGPFSETGKITHRICSGFYGKGVDGAYYMVDDLFLGRIFP